MDILLRLTEALATHPCITTLNLAQTKLCTRLSCGGVDRQAEENQRATRLTEWEAAEYEEEKKEEQQLHQEGGGGDKRMRVRARRWKLAQSQWPRAMRGWREAQGTRFVKTCVTLLGHLASNTSLTSLDLADNDLLGGHP